MNWYLKALKNYADFKGRSRRKEYWFFFLFNIIAAVALIYVDSITGTLDPESSIGFLSGIYMLAVLIPALAVLVRRLHDTGRSGWWALIGLVPIAGLILFFFAAQDGKPEDNQWGSNPKGAASSEPKSPADREV